MVDTSSSLNKNVGILAGVSAAILLCGSAFFLWRSRQTLTSSGGKAEWNDVIDHAQELGEVRYDDSPSQQSDGGRKLLEKKYFTDLVALITFHVRQEFREERTTLLAKRREAYKAENWTVYEDIVREIYLKQETLFNSMCEEVFEHLSISKEAFLDS